MKYIFSFLQKLILGLALSINSAVKLHCKMHTAGSAGEIPSSADCRLPFSCSGLTSFADLHQKCKALKI